MAVLRHQSIINPSPTQPLAWILAADGKDGMIKSITRPLSAGDIGDGAGQTRHAQGCLVAGFAGADLQQILAFHVLRPQGDGWLTPLEGLIVGSKDAKDICKVALKMYKDSLFFKDLGNDPSVYIQAGDILQMILLLGNIQETQ